MHFNMYYIISCVRDMCLRILVMMVWYYTKLPICVIEGKQLFKQNYIIVNITVLIRNTKFFIGKNVKLLPCSLNQASDEACNNQKLVQATRYNFLYFYQ